MLAACSDDVADTDKLTGIIEVEGSIDPETVTRAVGDTWNNADQIGVSGGGKANALYSTTSAAKTATFTSGNPVYYTDPASYYDAYYPYTSSPTTKTNATTVFTVTTGPTQNASESTRKAIDVLWAKTASAVPAGTNVAFAFTHMLSELIITFDWTGTGFGGSVPSSWSFTIGSVKQSATVTINHSQYSSGWSEPSCTVAASGSASDYTVSDWNSNTYTMIAPAQDLSAHAFSVTADGITYSGTLPYSFSLSQSNKSTVTIKVGKTGLNVTTAIVSVWGNGTESNNSAISATI